MQCPSCDVEAPQSAFGEPLRCPTCGAYYEKALRLKLAQSAPAVAVRAPAEHVQSSVKGLNGAQPVVVVDVQMRFWSMVVFIVKGTLAAIPALLILMFLGAAVVSFFGVWLTALFS